MNDNQLMMKIVPISCLFLLLLFCLFPGTRQQCHAACRSGCLYSNDRGSCGSGCNNNYLSSSWNYWIFWTYYSCSCPSGTYNADLSYCPSCHYSCRTCYGGSANQCYACPSGANRYDAGTSCPCNSGYWDVGATVCACAYTCLTCNGGGNSACTSCASSWQRTLSGSTCPCNTGYYDAGASSCYSCHYSCLTCVSASTTCTSCLSSNQRTLSSSSCPCDTYYYDSGSANCSSCHYSCRTCVSAATTCTSCQSSATHYRSLSGNACPCITSYYDSGTATCSACHFSCYTCVTSANTCTSCLSSRFRSLSGSTCPCIAGYYEVGSSSCPQCHYSCLTCTGTATNCTSCSSSWYRTLSGNTCPCNNPYYDNGTASVCQPCHHSCASCTNSSTCVSCASSLQRIFASTSTYCLCNDRYFDPGVQTCSVCHNTCLRCSGSATNQCTACNFMAFRTLSGTTCVCANGYYATSATLELCSLCSYSCKTCVTASTTCTSCDTAGNRVLTSSTCPCKAKYFENSTLLCQDCHSSCATCTNFSACVTCITAQATIIDSSGLCSCASTHYWNGSTCLACNYKCLTCENSSTTCMTCPSNSNRVYFSHTCNCVEKFYDNGASVACLACHYSCLTCSGSAATNCLTCQTSTRRTKSGTSCLCPAKYYDDQSGPMCLQCHYSCATCTQASSCATCSSAANRVKDTTTGYCSCLSTYFQSSQTCYACLSTCLTCSNNQTCTSCNSALFRTLSTSTSQCQCMKGYYLANSGTCSACDSVCAECTQAGTCTICKGGLYRQLNSVTYTCDCKSGYILNTTSNLCMGCVYSCQVCVTNFDTKCQSCNSSTFRQLDTTTKQCNCKVGYYDDGINPLCLPCHYTCLSCHTTSTNCTACPVGSNRVHSSTGFTCLCAQHFYDQMAEFIQSSLCKPCLYHCSTCSIPSACLTCDSAKHRQFDTAQVNCICSTGYFDNKTSSETCAACPYQCHSCTNNSECLTCNTAHFRAVPGSLCPCINNYFDDGTNSPTCAACHYSCKTCTNGSKCVSCEISYSRVMDTPSKLCICLDRFFDPGQQACQACSYSCMTCDTNPLNCLTCNSTALRNFNAAANSCDCQDGYYDSAIEECKQCQYSCATCGNNRSCLTCDSAHFRQYSLATALCVCSVGYYDTLLDEKLCKRCELTCLTCLNASLCETCDPARLRVKNTTNDYLGNSDPYCPCFYSHYSIASNDSCAPCHYSCAVCSGPNVNNCLYCSADDQRTLKPSKKCICNDLYYDDNVTMACPRCHLACATCWDALNTTCFTCDPNFYMAVGNNTCFMTCPTYWFDNTTHMICTACSANCLVCIDGTNCTSCEAPTFLDLAIAACVLECPLTFYGDNTTRQCEPCRVGCANCTEYNNCFQCVNTSYFVDQTSTICWRCSELCLTCYGPTHYNCLTCTYPLYKDRSDMCVPLLCPYGQYVHSVKGCQPCGQLFAHSLKCNITHAMICERSTLLENGLCVSCTSVRGYHLDSTGDCNQICGDGYLIKYQCDDGNRKNGDGCSSNCLIQPGWTCVNSSTGSKCTLQASLTMSLTNIHKYARVNSLLLVLQISLDLYVDNTNFGLQIVGLDPVLYAVEILPQKVSNLKEVQCKIDYQTSLAGKLIKLQYNKAGRRLQEVGQLPQQIQENQQEVYGASKRMLISVAFQVTVDSFPPANYIDSSTTSFYANCDSTLQILSLTLIVMCLIVVPRKWALHSLSLSWLPPYIYLVYFHSTAYTNDWISASVGGLARQSIKGGVTLGDCCSMDSIKGTSSEFLSNAGLIILAMVVGWAIYGLAKLVDSCRDSNGKQSKGTGYVWYYLLTVQLIVLMQVSYYSVYALGKYTLNNRTDAINITLSLFMLFSVLFFMASLWYLTFKSKFEGTEDNLTSKAATRHTEDKEPSNQTEERDYHQVINMSAIKESTKYEDSNFYMTNRSKISASLDSKRPIMSRMQEQKSQTQSNLSQSIVIPEEVGENDSVFPYDYCYLYKNSDSRTKYFLPLLVTKLILSSIIAVALSSQAFAMMVLLSIVSFIFLLYLLVVRPFHSKFTTIRLIVIELLLTAVNGVYCVYQFYASKSQYVVWLEKAVIIMLIIVLSAAVLFGFIEHYRSWIKNIWSLCDGCCLYLRLLGRSTKVYAAEEESRQQVKVEQVQEGDVVQDEAFYARVLKKEKVKRQYRKERMIRETNMTQKDFLN